jgi:hypothetical protein
MVIKERVPGEIIQANGCYSNGGMVGIHTSKLNRNALGSEDMEKAVLVVQNSQNSKIGDMHATYAPQLTCPTSCPFYPEIYGDIRDPEQRAMIQVELAEIEARKIDELPANKNLRVHVVGDCSNHISANLIGSAMVRYEKRSKNNSIAYTYTHAWDKDWVEVPVHESEWMGAKVLASCETSQGILDARKLGYACEWTYMEHTTRKVHERDGIKVLPCPNNFNADVKCTDCMKCADLGLLKKKEWVIGLSVHGPTKLANKSIERRQ